MFVDFLLCVSRSTIGLIDLFYNFLINFSGVMFAIKVTLLFLLIVLIRITVPRLRLETLSRSSWLLGLTFVGFWVMLYFLIFLYI